MISVSEPQAAFVPVNGLQMYVAEQGQGDPVVLVHGAIVDSGMWWSHLQQLASQFRVVMPDSRGHGRTDYSGGPITYQMLADDLVALIRALGLERPFICGYSDGGQIALDLVVRYPDVARAVIIAGATYRWSPVYYATATNWGLLGAQADGVLEHAPFLELVEHLRGLMAPHFPEHGEAWWRQYHTNMMGAWATQLPYTEANLREVVTPTLLLVGDRDEFVPIEDVLAMYQMMSQPELAVVPGATHGLFLDRPGAFTSVVLDFLERQQVAPGL
jgi:pimeloyl-ACP methyl ester carboxylesterase